MTTKQDYEAEHDLHGMVSTIALKSYINIAINKSWIQPRSKLRWPLCGYDGKADVVDEPSGN